MDKRMYDANGEVMKGGHYLLILDVLPHSFRVHQVYETEKGLRICPPESGAPLTPDVAKGLHRIDDEKRFFELLEQNYLFMKRELRK